MLPKLSPLKLKQIHLRLAFGWTETTIFYVLPLVTGRKHSKSVSIHLMLMEFACFTKESNLKFQIGKAHTIPDWVYSWRLLQSIFLKKAFKCIIYGLPKIENGENNHRLFSITCEGRDKLLIVILYFIKVWPEEFLGQMRLLTAIKAIA